VEPIRAETLIEQQTGQAIAKLGRGRAIPIETLPSPQASPGQAEYIKQISWETFGVSPAAGRIPRLSGSSPKYAPKTTEDFLE